jgi:Fe2+ transport system protein FeoA
LRLGQKAVILRVTEESPQFLRHLTELGLVPGAHLTITAFSPFDNNLTIEVAGHAPLILGMAVTFKILVEKIPGAFIQ